ncbi:general transcription factor 3C polypeptide 5 isoform 2-T2 [Pluvialis apricaria]
MQRVKSFVLQIHFVQTSSQLPEGFLSDNTGDLCHCATGCSFAAFFFNLCFLSSVMSPESFMVPVCDSKIHKKMQAKINQPIAHMAESLLFRNLGHKLPFSHVPMKAQVCVCQRQKANLILSLFLREGYNNPQVSGENLIGLSRARRPHNAIFVNFDDEEIPTKPLDAAVQTWKKVCTNPVDKKVEEELRKLFEVRPVWSRNAVKANISVHPDKLKLLLPYLAYYMLTGPWRSLWVRFGYDPRKHPEAKIYQVLDFRIRCGMKYGYAPNDMPVKAKRSTYNYSLPITVKKPVSHTVSVHDLKQGLGTSGASGAKKSASSRYKLKESIYIFREGALPPYRQMFYQLCDLNVESLQKIIRRNDGTESECTERDGWCLPKTSDDLRDTMSLMIKQIIRSTRPALFSNTTSSEDGKEQLAYESGEEEDDEEEEEEDFKPSDGSENEMETEILDYV